MTQKPRTACRATNRKASSDKISKKRTTPPTTTTASDCENENRRLKRRKLSAEKAKTRKKINSRSNRRDSNNQQGYEENVQTGCSNSTRKKEMSNVNRSISVERRLKRNGAVGKCTDMFGPSGSKSDEDDVDIVGKEQDPSIESDEDHTDSEESHEYNEDYESEKSDENGLVDLDLREMQHSRDYQEKEFDNRKNIAKSVDRLNHRNAGETSSTDTGILRKSVGAVQFQRSLSDDQTSDDVE